MICWVCQQRSPWSRAQERSATFNGLIDRVQFFGAPYPGQWSYQLELVPWSAMLDKVADCRIFQEITVPDLLKKVFADSGFTDYELKLNPHLSRARVLRAVPRVHAQLYYAAHGGRGDLLLLSSTTSLRTP